MTRSGPRWSTFARAAMASAIGLACATPPILPDGPLEPGRYRQQLEERAGGLRRSYRISVPERYDGSRSLPLVVALHGGMSSARTLERRSGLNAAGDRFGFFAVHANGEGALGAFRHWNAGHCCAEAMWRRRDDVGFVLRVIDDVSERVRVDPERVYLVGFSNGGMLAWRFAAEYAERVAGVVPIAATVAGALERDDPYGRLPRPARPVPLMLFRGANDRRTPAVHADASLAHWAERNGCAPQPEVRSLREGALQVREWSDCAPGAAVSAVELEDWGHRWPGRHFSRRRRDALRDFDGVDLWWSFFESQRAQAGR